MSLALFIKVVAIGAIVVILAFVFSLIDLYLQLNRYQSYWDNQNNTQEPDYVALGDSTAQGIGASHPSKGYVGIIKRRLNSEHNHETNLVNLSKSGARLHDALNEQIPALEKLKINESTVVTIEIGANDMISFDAKKFEKEIDELMGKLPKQTLMTDIPSFSGSRFASKETNVIEANKIMYALARKHGFELVPLYDQVKKNGGLKIFAVDWFHPSDYSYRENWAKVLLDRIEK